MSNALAKIGSTGLAPVEYELPAALDPEVMAAMKEEMDGLTMRFERVKIPSAGGIAWEIPGDDPDNPDVVKTITGVIVDHHPLNRRYVGEFNPDRRPVCASGDGKNGLDDQGVAHTCATCQFNQWGSGTDQDGNPTRGKACSNIHRLYILREGDAFPLQIDVPPTSLGNLSTYISHRLLSRGLLPGAVVTEMSLRKDENAAGIEYSQVMLSLVGPLSTEKAQQMIAYGKSLRPVTRSSAVAMADGEPAAAEESESETPGSEELAGAAAAADPVAAGVGASFPVAADQPSMFAQADEGC